MDVDAFRALLAPEGQRCLAAAVALGVSEATALAAATTLRREYPAPLVAAAITQARLRARAATKFGADAAPMYFTTEGLEQATTGLVAAHHAARYPVDARIADLCCGIGGDLHALAAAHDVLAVERDPLTAAIAAANVAALGLGRATVWCADATALDLAGYDAAFLDPARRANGRRVFNVHDYAPPWSFIAALAGRVGNVGVKVAPGIPHDLVPPEAEAEWVSVRGDVKEAALWFGGLRGANGANGANGAEVRRRATLLTTGATGATAATLTDADLPPDAPPVGPPRRYLYEPDGAVIRSGLVAAVVMQVGGTLLDPTIAYITSDAEVRTPFARVWPVVDTLPFGLKRLRAYLRERGIGQVVVKKRGSPLEPDALTHDLRLSGPHTATLFLTRVSGVHTVIVSGGGRRAAGGEQAAESSQTAHIARSIG